ncbi:NAD(P)/FAD-dependent oxidoreductase [Mycolicibacterium iranicum]|uniref:Pyridine nucleotide-disulfide oxidoreductase n=1 Tax=Mycolicibacterium iranicum TaxID=912594 RepID=A0A1X1WRQ7_MYCIR|nr:FAD-dependent oxidoreductase [Mycolicibacterium iranicum]ORV89209.1 pyridine nucleotide-disulfide oxidoreductase [Mycolicibacterium iranicum]
MSDVAVAIVGGGPSGLTAAAALAPHVSGEVLVLERESQTGGIPRHSDHPGYGMRDLHRFISGPAYARRLTESAVAAGATLETEAMVTGWSGERAIQVTSPRGVRTVTADAVVLATGARERPRPARLVPGDRPEGVYTTGQLQNLVHLHHAEVGNRAVIVGAELVSWSAVLTLREAGCATVAMVSSYPRAEAYAAFRAAGRLLLGGPVMTRSRLVGIHGKHRVQSVTVEEIGSGRRREISCDTVVFTGDWIPDHELSRTAGLQMHHATRGPVVDTALRTSRPGVFAVGNLLHPVDTADAAALDGRHVAAGVKAWLRHGDQLPASTQGAPMRVEAPLRWVTPQLLSPDGAAPARGDLLLWTDEYRRFPKLRAVQDGRVLATKRTPWPAAPGRIYRAPWSLVAGADPKGGTVTLTLL